MLNIWFKSIFSSYSIAKKKGRISDLALFTFLAYIHAITVDKFDIDLKVLQIREKIKWHNNGMEEGTIKICAECPRRDRHDEEPCKVIRKGKPWRTGVRLPNGEMASVRVQELKCHQHGKFRICPLFILPRKHYVAEIVEEALAAPIFKENVKAFCNRWTILDAASPARWIREFGKNLVNVAQSAERRLLGLQDRTIAG